MEGRLLTNLALTPGCITYITTPSTSNSRTLKVKLNDRVATFIANKSSLRPSVCCDVSFAGFNVISFGLTSCICVDIRPLHVAFDIIGQLSARLVIKMMDLNLCGVELHHGLYNFRCKNQDDFYSNLFVIWDACPL
jgi:hypothetical protein